MSAVQIPINGSYPPTTLSIALYVWAESPKDAVEAVRLPAERCPRYLDVCDALVQRDHGNDGYEGETLYRVIVEEVHP